MHVESAIASLHPLCDRCYDWKKNCINFCLPVGVCTCILNGPFFFRHFITTLYTSNPPPLHPFNKFNKITATIYCFSIRKYCCYLHNSRHHGSEMSQNTVTCMSYIYRLSVLRLIFLQFLQLISVMI